MKYTLHPTSPPRSTGFKVVLALAMTVAVAGMSFTPVYADNDRGRGAQQNRNDHDQRNNRNQRHKHDRRDYRPGYGYYHPPYYYAQPVYVPPPVYYYEPPRSPGISLFFPLDFRH